MECQGNDRWTAAFTADAIGLWQYFITARVDAFGTWLRDLFRRRDAGEDLRAELLTGASMVSQAAHRAPPAVATELEGIAATIATATGSSPPPTARRSATPSRSAASPSG